MCEPKPTTDAPRCAGRVDITGELLTAALGFPEGTRILDIMRHPMRADTFAFVLEHDDLPRVQPGDPFVLLTPDIEADYSKQPRTWLKFNWRLPGDKRG